MANSSRFYVDPEMFVRLEGKKRERFGNNADVPPPPDEDEDYVFFDEGGDGDGNGDGEEEAGNAVAGLGNRLDGATSDSAGA